MSNPQADSAPKRRFSSRVSYYVKARPGYPPEILEFLIQTGALATDSVIADVGCGTGLLAELFLKNDNTVFGVEPNPDMRTAGEQYLAAYPQATHTREGLTEQFWPESDPAAGRASLRQALASMRRLLEPLDVPAGTVLIADRSQVRLNPDAIRTDLAQWDRARALCAQSRNPRERMQLLDQAIRQHGGAFLPGSVMDWAAEERQRRQDQYLEALLSLIDLQAECGEYDAAVGNARRLLQEDPLSEEGHERLMRLFAEQGRLGLARAQYRKLCRILQDELNLDPAPKTQALFSNLKQIWQQRPGASTAGQLLPPLDSLLGAAACPADSAALPSLPVRLTRFFGREEEMRALVATLRDPAVRLTTLTGIGGIGKTRLALEVARQATLFGAAITFVSLSETQESDLLLAAILQALGLPAGLAI